MGGRLGDTGQELTVFDGQCESKRPLQMPPIAEMPVKSLLPALAQPDRVNLGVKTIITFNWTKGPSDGPG